MQSTADDLYRRGLAGFEESRAGLGDFARQSIPGARGLFVRWLTALEAFGVSQKRITGTDAGVPVTIFAIIDGRGAMEQKHSFQHGRPRR